MLIITSDYHHSTNVNTIYHIYTSDCRVLSSLKYLTYRIVVYIWSELFKSMNLQIIYIYIYIYKLFNDYCTCSIYYYDEEFIVIRFGPDLARFGVIFCSFFTGSLVHSNG